MKWESGKTRVYVHAPRWYIRPGNTDWRYARFVIPRLSEFIQDCAFYPARSMWTMAEANGRFLQQRIGRYLRAGSATRSGTAVDKREFARKGCDVVFCHEEFPRNGESFPIVWQNSVLDPEMLFAYGMSRSAFEKLVDLKLRGFHKAIAVQVSTEAERERLSKSYPELAHKFVAIPFFLPDLASIGEEDFCQKNDRKGLLRCLFVGHEARRKGLARVYDAMSTLPETVRKRIHLTVISKEVGGGVTAPALPNLSIEPQVPYSRVQQLMRESDVFVMPSLFESYGLVYLEAMSQGTIPIVPDWEVQREIADYGRAGMITSGRPEDIAAKLEQLCDDDNFRHELSASALRRFRSRFAPGVVANQFGELFRRFGER